MKTFIPLVHLLAVVPGVNVFTPVSGVCAGFALM